MYVSRGSLTVLGEAEGEVPLAYLYDLSVLPKGSRFEELTERSVKSTKELFNSGPRKTL